VKQELVDIAGNLLEFTEEAEAEQFRATEEIRTEESTARHGAR
jgi:hypothetical protein